jgi:hypothetical protein
MTAGGHPHYCAASKKKRHEMAAGEAGPAEDGDAAACHAH